MGGQQRRLLHQRNCSKHEYHAKKICIEDFSHSNEPKNVQFYRERATGISEWMRSKSRIMQTRNEWTEKSDKKDTKYLACMFREHLINLLNGL